VSDIVALDTHGAARRDTRFVLDERDIADVFKRSDLPTEHTGLFEVFRIRGFPHLPDKTLLETVEISLEEVGDVAHVVCVLEARAGA
jgi:hypothetical protein